MDNTVDSRRKDRGKSTAFPRRHEGLNGANSRTVDESTQETTRPVHVLFALFPQALGIKLLPDFSDLLTNSKVELNGLFDLVDRMNSGCVIFAT